MARRINYRAKAHQVERAIRNDVSSAAAIRRHCPQMLRQIESDCDRPGILSLWGQSLNVDENAGATIVLPEVIQAIESFAGTAPANRPADVVHAGLQHTYGYLLSTLETPYGFKRDRWVQPDIEDGFQITGHALRPSPSAGTLLTNLTWFLGRIAFTQCPRELRCLRRCRDEVSPYLTSISFRRLSIVRLIESVRVGRRSQVHIHTDFVKFPRQGLSNNTHLLVYSVADSRKNPRQLITAFPVSEDFVRNTTNAAGRSNVPIETRYNGYVAGVTGEKLPGTRSIACFGRGDQSSPG